MSGKKKKIIICGVQLPFVYGGAELHVDSLNTELQKRGYQSAIVNIPFKWYPRNEIMKHALVWRILDLSEVDGQKIDVVITTKFPSYGIRHENKVTWLLHQYRQLYDLYLTPYSEFTTSVEDQKIRQMVINFDNQMLSESKKIYANSQTVAARLWDYNKILSEPLYHPPKHVGRYYCDQFQNYVLTISRLENTKRVDLLIRAMQYTSTSSQCLIIGQGSKFDELKQLIASFNLEDRVHLLGFRTDDELLSLLANAGLVYYAPYDEDYGYVTLEAFFSKKPVLTTTDAGGVLEFAKDQQNAYVRRPDPEELGQAIDALLQNKQVAKELGQAGLQSVKDISWDRVIDRLITC